MIDSKDILQKVGAILEDEKQDIQKQLQGYEKLDQYIIPALEKNKNTLASLYQFAPKTRQGIVGKIKGKILQKLHNVVINAVERESMRQQKYNDLLYQAILELKKAYEQNQQK